MSNYGKDPRHTKEWRKLSRQCYERDKAINAQCWIGKHAINYNVKPSSTPDSYEPDHYFPVATHPELALVPENIRPACKACNRARRSKAGIDNVGNRSREW